MSTESIIIKAIVITVLFMLIALTPTKTHAAQMHVPTAVSSEDMTHARQH